MNGVTNKHILTPKIVTETDSRVRKPKMRDLDLGYHPLEFLSNKDCWINLKICAMEKLQMGILILFYPISNR